MANVKLFGHSGVQIISNDATLAIDPGGLTDAIDYAKRVDAETVHPILVAFSSEAG